MFQKLEPKIVKPITDLDDLRNFIGIVDHGGLSAAVAALGMPKSTISRRLSSLEERVGSRLIDRSAHSFRLTETGSTFYGYAQRILEEVTRMTEAMQPGEPSGILRITTGYGLAVEVLGPIIPEFLRRYPQINIDLEASSELRDLARDDFDLALRAGPLTGGSLVARRLGKSEIGLFASPEYLTNTGNTVKSISSRPTIGLNRSGKRNQLADEKIRSAAVPRPRLVVNDPLLIKIQLLAGAGTGWLPIQMTRDDVAAGRLVPVNLICH
jgi:DNA-binding transcriptional LysR family regulator